ncbi:MAG: LysR substrate-binding domain-containing protein, partial [Caldimonas sp.]
SRGVPTAPAPARAMNLTQLTYFIRVAEMGSFSKAALVLDVAQPALSRQVRLLETDLRTTLLHRTGRGVVLTDAGKRLFEHSVGILQLVALAREDLEATRAEATGRIVVGLPPSMGRLLTLPLVDEFKRVLPQARLAIVEGLSAHIVEWISTGRVDLGLVHNPEANPAIETTPVLDEPLWLVSAAARRRGASTSRSSTSRASTSRTSVLRGPAPLPFAELPAYALIVPERTHAIRKVLETQAALKGVKLQIAWEVSSVQSILDLVRHGHGHAVLARSAVPAAGAASAFELRPLAEAELKSTLCLAKSAHKPVTPLVRRAERLLRELLMAHVVPSGKARASHADRR